MKTAFRDLKIGNRGYFAMLGFVAIGLALYFIWLMTLGFPPPNGIVEDTFVAELLGHNTTELGNVIIHGRNHMEEVPAEIRIQLLGTGVGD